jgi:uncharacterized phage protein (TIGR01671 family)
MQRNGGVMREIKFRCWHKNGKHLGKMKFEPAMIYDEKPGDCLQWKNQGQEIIEIMQFTGLHDRNGKPIYDGDICRFDVTELPGIDCLVCDIIGEAMFDEQDAGYFFSTKTQYPYVKPWCARNIEIIGNRFKNPELMEE